MKISVVTLGVADVSRARDFYRVALGLGQAQTKGSVVYFSLDGVALALCERNALGQYLGVEGDQAASGNTALSINVDAKTDVDQRYARVVDAGGVEIRAPHEAAWGGYVATFTDPDNHVWEFVWNPRPFL